MAQIFKISSALVFLCPYATRASICKHLRSPGIDSQPLPIADSLILMAKLMICRKTLRKLQFGEKSANVPYTRAYIVQQSSCRRHCDFTFFSGKVSTMNSLFRLFLFFPSPISPSLIPPSPNPPSHLPGQFYY
jgi:hypothetical protein